MEKFKPVYLIYLVPLAYLLYLFYRIAWFDSLTSIANDSVNYLAMARHYSPWIDESDSIRSVWPLQDFPPLFPVILALTGAAHSLLYAHALVGLFGLGGLYALYRFASTMFSSPMPGNTFIILSMLCPGFIFGIQGILSETPYLFFSILFLLLFRNSNEIKKTTIAGLGILLAAVMLTRTVGFALWIAVLLQGLLAKLETGRVRYSSLVIAALSLFAYLLFMVLFGPDRSSHYSNVLVHVFSSGSAEGHGGLIDAFMVQMASLLDAWRTFLIIYWVGSLSVTHIVVMVLLIISLAGLISRFRANKLDALYVVIYLVVLTVWPHPGQMVRLIMPVMPLLILYAFVEAVELSARMNAKTRQALNGILYSILLVTVLPAHAFINGRIGIASELGVVPVYESFRKIDAAQAERELRVQNGIMRDLSALGKYVNKDDAIIYFIPSYVAILADRQGIVFPEALSSQSIKRSVRRLGAKYIFLSSIHPRKTREGYDGLIYARYLAGWTEKLWCSTDGNITVSCLYHVADGLNE